MSTTLLDQLRSALADRYVIERELGRGGMATVYLARDRKHDRFVALKVLNPDLGAVLGVDRFLSEIRVTATLQHPHLLPLFDSGSVDGLLYYVMPFVDGESLRRRLDRERQLPVDEVVRIAVAVAEALEYAHARGVIHRDLKPENILLQAGQPVVADFGIALAVSNAGGERITRTGLSLGTPQYMSPEQATGDQQLDARTDVYSLAAVAYEMLAGEPPHHGGTAQAVIARVLTERPASVRTRRASVPEAVAHAIEVALEKVPADRWSSAREFAEALQGRAPRRTAAGRVDVRTGTARRRAWAAAMVASLAALAALAGVGWWRALRSPASTMATTLGLGPDLVLASNYRFPLAISPDGQTIAYIVRSAPGRGQMVVKRADELRGRPLPGTEGAARPVFSADGRSIAYVAGEQLRVVPAAGGAPVLVPSGRAVASGWPPAGLAWADNGTFVIGPNRASGLAPVLHVLPASGGEPRALARRLAAGETEQRWPIVLSDEETVFYTSYDDQNDEKTAHIGIASLQDGEATRLDLLGIRALGLIDGALVYVTWEGQIRAVPIDLKARRVTGPSVMLLEGVMAFGGPVAAALARNGTLVYLAGDSEAQEVLFVDETGARKAFEERKDYVIARVSPDGGRVALMVDRIGGVDIWILDRVEGSIAPFTTDGRGFDPEWSADGRWIYFVRNDWNTAAADSIFRQPVDRSAPPSLVSIIGGGGLEAWTLHPRGRILVFQTIRGPARVRRLDGDTVSQPLMGATTRETGYRFSPDGRWLCFVARDQGTSRVFVRPFPAPTPRVQVSTARGTEPVWSADGRRLYYRDGEHFVAADLDFTAGPRVTRRTTLIRDEGFDDWGVPPGYDVTRDGRLVLIREALERYEVVVITNWDRQVRARLREPRAASQ